MTGVIIFEIIVLGCAALLFALRYAAVEPWWSSALGRISMGTAVGVGLLMVLLFLLGVGFVAPLWTWAVVLGFLDVVVVAQTYMLFRLQRAGRQSREGQNV